jgi:hypothetical protein
VQAEVSLKVSVIGPSAPHEKLPSVVGVQLSVVAGAVPVQWLPSTTVPSARTQETIWVAVPEFAVAIHVPERDWVRFVPQPVVGAQEVYRQVPVPPAQVPKPPCVQLNVQLE